MYFVAEVCRFLLGIARRTTFEGLHFWRPKTPIYTWTKSLETEKKCLIVCLFFQYPDTYERGLRPLTRFCFFSCLASCLHAYDENGDRKHKRSPQWSLLKSPFSCTRVQSEWMRTDVFFNNFVTELHTTVYYCPSPSKTRTRWCRIYTFRR